MPTTRDQVAELLAAGVPRAEIARRLGVSKPTVTYHAKRLGHPVLVRGARRYDWVEVQRLHDSGVGAVACMQHFGFSTATWYAAIDRGDLVPRPRAMSIEELLTAPRNRNHLKRRLFDAGLKEERCELCRLTEWSGKPLVLQLHHVNGVGDDNRLENLQVLCPNCHSQTENWGGRNSSAAARASRSRPDRDAA